MLKRKEEILTNEELAVLMYMFNLRLKRLGTKEKVEIRKQIEDLNKLLDRVYDSL
jgi:SHS2 domain-containing protein